MGNFAENLNLGNRVRPPCKFWQFWERPLFEISMFLMWFSSNFSISNSKLFFVGCPRFFFFFYQTWFSPFSQKKKKKLSFLIKFVSKMDFLIHSKKVYFYIHCSCSLKVMALSIFQNFWVVTNFKARQIGHYVMGSLLCESLLTNTRFHFLYFRMNNC